jgi:hypothetical protein
MSILKFESLFSGKSKLKNRKNDKNKKNLKLSLGIKYLDLIKIHKGVAL